MITYNRSAFGLNLVFRVHGSAVYRSILPSLLSVAIFFLIHFRYKYGQQLSDQQELGHPYAIGVLVGSVSFLIVFRASQGYARYWEGATSVFHMMSKWMDATTHSYVYHLQCDHYKDIKPPSFFDYPELNHLFLTRDRERGADYYAFEDDDDFFPGKNFRSNSYPPDQSTRRGTGGRESISGSGLVRSVSTRISMNLEEKKVERKIHKIKKKEQRERAKVKSINSLSNSGGRSSDSSFVGSRRFGPGSSKTGVPSPLIGQSFDHDDEFIEEFLNTDRVLGDRPTPLVGKPRLDGNWSYLYKDNRQVFYAEDDNLKGFASIDGGRTPPLFLQELAHLSSLLVAVAFSTLRNDMEGFESPLSFYKPGKPWPEVDPDREEILRHRGFKGLSKSLLTFIGMGRSPQEQTRYNASRPLPVIGGVSDAEIRFLQMARGPYAKTQMCWNWLSEFIIREHLAGSMGAVGPPIISRIIQFLGDGMIYYNYARKIMFIPFPFPHAQLSVMFILVLVPCIPFLMDQYVDEVWLAAVLTFLTVMCLSGIHEVARELENPFRNVPNELPLVTFQAEYNEALFTMYSGWHPGQFWDGDKILRRQNVQREKKESSPGVGCKKGKAADHQSEIAEHRSEIAELKRLLAEQSKLINQLTRKMSPKHENETKRPERENSFHPRYEERDTPVTTVNGLWNQDAGGGSSDEELDSELKDPNEKPHRVDMLGDVYSVNSSDMEIMEIIGEVGNA
eukprot:scaffold11977_cov107-Cylindrotheca_fusiformis.AAC.1